MKSNDENLRSLILNVLANPDGARQVAELESRGEHVAARVMEEGQRVCDPYITSPSPMNLTQLGTSRYPRAPCYI